MTRIVSWHWRHFSLPRKLSAESRGGGKDVSVRVAHGKAFQLTTGTLRLSSSDGALHCRVPFRVCAEMLRL